MDVALRHVASRTVIRGVLASADRGRDRTALFRVTGETFQPEIRRCLLFGGLEVRIMARNAAEARLTSPVTLAKDHGKIVLEKITLRRCVAPWRNHENCEPVIEW